jgi:surface antigen
MMPQSESGGTDVRLDASAIFLGATLILVSGFGSVVQAQINPFRGLGPKLTGDDVQLLLDSTARLNKATAPKSGESDDWNNPRTGAHGSTTLTKIYRYHDMACHTLRYQVSPNSTRPLRTYTLDWCETPNGEWKVKS